CPRLRARRPWRPRWTPRARAWSRRSPRPRSSETRPSRHMTVGHELPGAGEQVLLAGLGNPGPRYEGNRHNIGFLVLDELADRVGGRFKAHKSGAEICEGRLAGRRVVLVKPRSFMNLSGGPVASAARFFKIAPEGIVVIHDELDLPYGT